VCLSFVVCPVSVLSVCFHLFVDSPDFVYVLNKSVDLKEDLPFVFALTHSE